MRRRRGAAIRGSEGAMTVEACIALPVFLMFFLLMLYFVNLCILYLSLNHAVDQTTKYLAANAYLYGRTVSVVEDQAHAAAGKILDQDLGAIGNAVLDQLSDTLRQAVDGGVEGAADAFLKGRTEELLKGFLADSKIPGDQVELSVLKLPGGTPSGPEGDAFLHACQEDDVVVQATYDMEFTLPFLGTYHIPVRSTCVERAFMKGWNGEHMNFKDQSFFS